MLGKAHLGVTSLSCFSFFFFLTENVYSFSFHFISFKHMFIAGISIYHSLTVDVSSVVGAPWRCGVLTTAGGIAGIGLGPHTWERA